MLGKVPCVLYLIKDAGIKSCPQHMCDAQSVCYASMYAVVYRWEMCMVTSLRHASCSKCAGLTGDCDIEVYVVECRKLLLCVLAGPRPQLPC